MIDWQRVSEMRDEFGAEDFAEILDLFMSEVGNAVDQLEYGERHPSAIEERMHFLKGASLNLGFAELATLCQTGEKAAASGDIDTVTAKQVRACFDESRLQFMQGYRHRYAA